MQVGDARFFTCQTGQKGICRFRATTSGRPGHGSMPHDENAVLQLCRSLGGLQGVQLPLHSSATMVGFIEGIAFHQEDETAALLRQVLDPVHSEPALRQLSIAEDLKAELRAVLRNTATISQSEVGHEYYPPFIF